VARSNINALEAVTIREHRKVRYFVGFDITADTLLEIDRFRWKKTER